MKTILLVHRDHNSIIEVQNQLPPGYRLVLAPYPEAIQNILSIESIDLAILSKSLIRNCEQQIQNLFSQQNKKIPIVALFESDQKDWYTFARSIGASEVLHSPVSRSQLNACFETLCTQNVHLEQNDPDVWGTSSTMVQLRHDLCLYAKNNQSVLLVGETGSGKEACARFIHKHSDRSKSKFFAINCASIASGLIESELFGSTIGAYTEAIDRPGWLEAASGSTLLLDEVGEIKTKHQSKLLRFLDNKLISRLGTHQDIYCDTRIIAATNRDIQHQIQSNQFRSDLFYRFEIVLRIPPLREHPKDVPLYAAQLLQNCLAENPNALAREFSDHALHALSQAHWTGNMRQLRAIVRRCVFQVHKPSIDYQDISWQDCR